MKRSEVRTPGLAGSWYPGSAAALERQVNAYLRDYAPPQDLGALLGGVVPHAGWAYSGAVAAKVFAALSAKRQPETYVLLGAVHRWGGAEAAVFPSGAWSTPIGQVPVDEEIASAMVEAGQGAVIASFEAHADKGENSIEVQVPLVQVLSPRARIVPVAVPWMSKVCQVGEAVAAAIRDAKKAVVVVASSDLTHYGADYEVPDHGPLPGAMAWMRENDRRFIRLVEALRAEEIVPEAMRNHNACGPGAVAAATAAARALGAKSGRLLEYTTSADVLNEPDADRAVGYAGMVFEKPSS